MDRVFNFAAGPSMLPEKVLNRAKDELLNYKGTGMSVMEMSHRSKVFQEIFDDAKNKFKRLMNVPDSHEVLFLQGGASSEFSIVPLNFISKTNKASYALTGNFSTIAYKEAKKYGDICVSYDGSVNGFRHIPRQSELKIDDNLSYFHYCDNNCDMMSRNGSTMHLSGLISKLVINFTELPYERLEGIRYKQMRRRRMNNTPRSICAVDDDL